MSFTNTIKSRILHYRPLTRNVRIAYIDKRLYSTCSLESGFLKPVLPALSTQQRRSRHKLRPTVYVGFARPDPQRFSQIVRTVFTAALFIMAGFVLPAILDEGPAAAVIESKDSAEANADEEESENGGEERGKKVGFRDRKIIEYENRIRNYSTPDKVFRYFATLKVFNAADKDYEIYMTPDDFLRSITPGCKQPENLGLDQFRKFDPAKEKLDLNVPHDSIFYKIGQNGLISFSDYMFLLTLLCTPWRYFEVAFRMFDFNGDGDVDIEEFERIQSVLRSQTAVGSRHRDHSNTGNVIRSPVSSALQTYFFGQNLKGKLTLEQFLRFRKDLHNNIQKMEFEKYEPIDGKISEIDFADWLLLFAGFSDKKRHKIMIRVKNTFSPQQDEEGNIIEEERGISWSEYYGFCKFLHLIMDVDAALQLHNVSGSRVDRATLARVARVITGFPLSEKVLDVMFVIFDVNKDGSLSPSEFIGVMKRRLMRGLERPKDIGFARLLNAMIYCTKQAISPNSYTQ